MSAVYKLIQKVAKKQRDLRESPYRLELVNTDDQLKKLQNLGLNGLSKQNLVKYADRLQLAYDDGLLDKLNSSTFSTGSLAKIYRVDGRDLNSDQDWIIAFENHKLVGIIGYSYKDVINPKSKKVYRSAVQALVYRVRKSNLINLSELMEKLMLDEYGNLLSDYAYTKQGEDQWHKFVKSMFDKGYSVYSVFDFAIMEKLETFADYQKLIPKLFGTNQIHPRARILISQEGVNENLPNFYNN